MYDDKSAAALVFRCGLLNDAPRVACVFWSLVHRHDWYRANYGQWVDGRVLGTGHVTKFRMTSAPSTDWVDSDPSGLRRDEEFVASAPANAQVALAQLQNKMLLDIQERIAEPTPFVIGTVNMGAMQFYSCEFHTLTQSVFDVPDIQAFLKEGNVADISTFLQDYPLPSDTWLPASIDARRTTYPAFYCIKPRCEGHGVTAMVAIPDLVLGRSKEMKLTRRCRDRSGRLYESTLATIIPRSLVTTND
ncbi:MAG: hypothetical protein U0939_09495 [Pirellulales bacterium]